MVLRKGVRKVEKIRELRLERGASIKAVADSLGVSPQAVGKWERGEAYPQASLLPKLADILGVSIDALYGREAARDTT